MPHLTREEVEKFRANFQQYFDLSNTTIGGWADVLWRIIGSWLTLETQVQEQNREIQALRGSEEYEREIRIQTSKEQQALKKRVRELEENIALKQQWMEMAKEAISHCEINHKDQEEEE